MSASLVGSEMCIRDRSGSAGGKCTTAHVPVYDVLTLAGMALAVSREAVSYTHLTLPTICSV
eukprot:11780754-Alexandrium_andersonii.AAC.1